MKRADALAWIRIAGYHDDTASYTRLYIENRVSYTAARAAFTAGRAQRAAGSRCTCSDCKKEASHG